MKMRHCSESKSWPPSSIILAAAGIALVGTGLYFIVLRPPLLPEDMRYMGLSAGQLDIVRPRLETWLTQVFRVMGGYVLATGTLTITSAATSFRAHHWSAAIGAFISGAASIAPIFTDIAPSSELVSTRCDALP